MVQTDFTSMSNLTTRVSSNKLKKGTYRVVIAVALLILPVMTIASYLAGPKVPKSRRGFVKPANIHMMVPMEVDIPGIADPTFVPVEKADLKDDDLVIGVIAFGEARAYLKRAFAKGLTSHVLLDQFGATRVTVTHCDLSNCTRVFSSTMENSLGDIHCGGWMAEQELALLIAGKKYPQSSKEIPFDDLPYLITTWDKWRGEHPRSAVYLGTDNAIQEEGQIDSADEVSK